MSERTGESSCSPSSRSSECKTRGSCSRLSSSSRVAVGPERKRNMVMVIGCVDEDGWSECEKDRATVNERGVPRAKRKTMRLQRSGRGFRRRFAKAATAKCQQAKLETVTSRRSAMRRQSLDPSNPPNDKRTPRRQNRSARPKGDLHTLIRAWVMRRKNTR